MSGPIPILYTIPNFETAGSGRALLNIVARLDRGRFAPAICVQRRGGHLEAEVEKLGIPYLEAPYTVSARPLATLPLRARKASLPFRGHGFALWHSFHYLDDYTEPLVARFSGARAWVYTKKNMSWNRRAWYLRTLLATRVAAQNTDMMRDFFATPLFRRKSVLVPRGVDANRFRPDTPRRLRLRENRGISSGAIVVGCVAHLVPVKGHPTLIRAVAETPGVFLWLAGKDLDAGYVAELRRLLGELGLGDRVAFLGDVEDVPAFLAELDVFVLPTWDQWRKEGCPVALLEAMASGRACVATDIPGSRDIVESGGSGLLVSPRDPNDLARAIRRLAEMPELRSTLGREARRRVTEHFSIDGEVRAHEELYESALFGSRAARAPVA